MAQEAHEAPVGCSSSSTSPTNGVWMHAPPFPSWSPYAGTLLATAAGPAFGGDPSSSASADTRLPSEHLRGHVWNQTVLSTGGAHGSSTERGGSNGYGENFLSLLETSNVTPKMLEDVPAACDYLGGMDDGGDSSMAGPAAYGLDSVGRYDPGSSTVSPIKHDEMMIASSPLVYQLGNSAGQGSVSRIMPCYDDHEVKRAGNLQQQELGAPINAFLQQMLPSSVAIQSTFLNFSGIGNERVCPEGRVMEASFDTRSLPDASTFSGYRSSAELMRTNRHEQHIMSARTSGSGGSGAASDPKKRKSEEKVGGNANKSKQDTSNTSPPKAQAPKVKLGDKITALQQIVSPFGKTDTASVLFETIKYIRFLHEQIQVFSEPYMTTTTNKGHIQWGGEKKEAAGLEHDLRDRGLCLVPVWWTPQVYRDNSLPDCWTPAYRSCMYR